MVITNFEKTRKRYDILRKREIDFDVTQYQDDTLEIIFWVKWNSTNKWIIREKKVAGKKYIWVKSRHYETMLHTYKAVNDFIADKIKL